MPRKGVSIRLSAWVTLQALVAVQILPPFAYAQPKEISEGENLRAQNSEGASAAGLEQALVTRPEKGFGGRVDRVTEDKVQVAKRMVGEPAGETVWNAAANTLEPAKNVAPGNAAQVERVAGWAAEGLKWLLDHPVLPVIQRVWDRLGDWKIPVQFLANHAMTMDFNDEDSAVRLDVTIASDLDKPEYAPGRRLLYAVGMFHEAALAAGYTPREAIHLTLGLYQNMNPAEQKDLQEILRSPIIDHGNTWALFFEDAAHSEFYGVDTLALEKRLDMEVLLDVRREITEVSNHRERWVSWLMGQLQIDLPYDRIAFRKAAADFKDEKVEAGRRDAYEAIRKFDPKVEQANAERMSRVVREGWLPEDLPYPTLLAGRASRAFDNQAQLFANADYVLKTKELVETGRLLHQAAQGKDLMDRLRKLAANAPPAAREELGKAVKRVEELLAHLGPGADRVRQLVFSPAKAIPSTQADGALQQLEESLENFLTEASRAIESAKKQVVTESAERVSRRPASAQAALALTVSFQDAQRALSDFRLNQEDGLATLNDKFRAAVRQAESYAAAYSVLLQRPSPTGSINFRANELEAKPEQEEALRKLTRLGGQNLYMSPSYDWVAEATDLIEAIPLYISERTITVDGHTLTVFEVDQEGLEQTIRQMADYWAKNIDQTMDSEHVALAREIVVNNDFALKQMAAEWIKQGLPEEAAHRRALQSVDDPLARESLLKKTALTAAWIEREFDRRIEEVEKLIEKRWTQQKFIDRVDALREMIGKDPKQAFAQAYRASSELQPGFERFMPLALSRRRPLPAFHLLTTEAPGLVEGFIQAVLDEEMALRNVVRARKLEEKVRRRMQEYAERIQKLGWKVIQEFGYEPIVEKYEAQGLTRERAITQVIGDHIPIQEELAKLVVLLEAYEALEGPAPETDFVDPAQVDALLLRKQGEFNKQAWPQVWERNKLDPELAQRVAELQKGGQPEPSAIAQAIAEMPIYRQEMEATMRWFARQQVLEELDKEHPELHVKDRARRWYRDHSALAQTTARRETIASENLNGLMMDPRYAYSSGVVAQTADGKLRPTGTRKRYHLIYAPSRVNLGKGERKSVEVWPQWVGVTDPLAAAHVEAFYELINFNPQIRMIKEAENLKVSENQWTAMVRAIRNVQAYFVERLGFGDIEDLAWQFDQRDGLTGAALKQGESYQAGPTAGYCIPKDLLFKLFVATLQDDKKLSLIGIPKHLHAGVIDMMVELAVKQKDFIGSVVDWEDWAARELLSEQALNARFGAKGAKEVGGYLAPYIEMTGGVPVFQLTEILQLLALAGVPSPLLARAQALHSSLWSNWAERKLTLPAEEVNRSVVFSFAREIVEAAKEAQALNPSADIVSETLLRVHFYGTYKGDENYPSPPDVRYAWVMRAFMILSGFGKEVALSLDEEGQILARLSWDGFRPDSTDPEDMAVTQHLAKQFGTEPAVIERLKAAFPRHTTVGDITITVVPGVSSDDLLAFSSETKTLMGDVAEQVQAILQAKGISPGQMQANAVLHRDFPMDWVPLDDLFAAEQAALQKAVGGNFHPLVLRKRGPGTDFLTDLQGQDVAVFSVTHPEIMRLNPAHLRDRMMVGRPHSALTALDFVAQGRHRVWFDREVMLWYAAGRGMDEKGQPIADWDQRDSKGRKAIYRAFGFGREEYRPLLGTDLRGEVSRQERRAAAIYRALEQVAGASKEGLSRAVRNLHAQYEEWFDREQLSTEAGLAIQYEQQMLINRRWKPRDAVVREALVDLATGLPVEKFGEIHWLATGGMFLLNGAPKDQQDRVLATLRTAQQRMPPAPGPAAAGAEEDPRVALLIQPALTADTIRLAEKQGESFSVKASEAIAEKAVQRRKGLALEAARLAGLKARQEGFKSVKPLENAGRIPQALESARKEMDQMAGGSVPRSVGVVMGTAVQVLRRLAEELIPEKEGERQKVLNQIEKLTQGREMDASAWKSFGGTYEDHGILTRMFLLAGEARREEVLSAMELLYMTLALDKTSDFLALAPADVDERLLLRALASFYAETIDDHFYEYNPWALDPKRGPAFKDFYGDLGILKPEKAEELYRMSWEHHRALYRYVRELVFTRTGASLLPGQDARALFGSVKFGAAPDQDQLEAQAIGAGAPGHYELLWRAYNQFREMAFLRNDGFAMPVVFENMDPNNPRILDTRHRVNFAFLSMVGRTHYSRALMEAGQLADNLFITRDGKMVQLPGVDGEVLQISDAQFWLTRRQYAEALVQYKGMTAGEAAEQIQADLKSGRLTPKGIRVAARFTKPVTIGAVVPHHHHYLADRIWAAGYPGTDKSPGIYELSYSKVLYPKIYNPAEETGVYLPPEVDWYRADSEKLGSAGAKEAIIKMLRPFIEEHGIIVVKGAEESGARNFKRFDFIDPQARLLKGKEMEDQLAEAADFIYQVSSGQDVAIQRAIIVTPLSWMSAGAAQAFVERQIRDFSVAVNLDRHPKNWVYGTLRAIFSAGVPKDLTDPANWSSSHLISLGSLQVATNVGRQGTLEMLTADLVQERFREAYIRDLQEAGQKVMAATARYGKKYWDEVYVPAYRAKYGVEPREFDAAGTPYWWPRYLMLDFLPEPVWQRDGKEVPGARVVDVIPGDPKKGTEARFMLRDRDGELFEGKVSRFIFWLLEPNVGIGLWPNYWKREEVREKASAKREGREVNWSNIGVSDRVVLSNYLAAGESFLRGTFGDDYFGPDGPRRGSPDKGPAGDTGLSSDTALLDPTDDRVRMSPPVVRLEKPFSAEEVSRLLPHAQTFAVVTGKTQLMNHHLYPWVVAAMGQDVNVIGVHESWLTPAGKASRLIVKDPAENRLLDFTPEKPVSIRDAFIVELPQSVEVEKHKELTLNLARAGVDLVNPFGSEGQRRADDKAWLRNNPPTGVAVPHSVNVPKNTAEWAFMTDFEGVAKVSPQGVMIQPRSDTTEGQGVAWFDQTDEAGARKYLEEMSRERDVLISTYRGNVTYHGRPVVLRFNVAAGEVTSASAVVAPAGEKIASLGRKGETIPLQDLLPNLKGPSGPIAMTPEVWGRLKKTAAQAAIAVGLPVLGMDLVLEADAAGAVQGIVLEANARPGTLIFGERVWFVDPNDFTRFAPDPEMTELGSLGPQIQSHPAPPAGPAFWKFLGVQTSGMEEAVAAIRSASQRLGIELTPQWRGVGPDGLHSDHDPVILTLQWSPVRAVDFKVALETLSKKIAQVTSHPGVFVQFTQDYLTVALPRKVWAMRDALTRELPGKKVAFILGDSPTGDFLIQKDVDQEPFPVPFVQVLVQGLEVPPPDGYPHMVRAEQGPRGVEDVLSRLLKAAQLGRRYEWLFEENVADLPPEIRAMPVNPEELVIFVDVDGTLMGSTTTFDESQAGVGGQLLRQERKEKIVELARRGVDFRFITGKTGQDISFKRVQSDEERLIKPLGAALLKAGGSPRKIGFDGASGIQRARFTPAGELIWSRSELPEGGRPFSDEEAARIFHLLLESVESAAQKGAPPAAGMEEQQAITLEEWRKIIADPLGSGFMDILKERYGEDQTLSLQALGAYQQLIIGALASGFDPSKKIVIVVASPGRDRVNMGHTDFPGLGGFTINVATEEEILGVVQETEDGRIHLFNSNPKFKPAAFPVQEARDAAAQHGPRERFFQVTPNQLWNPVRWESYIKGALTWMVSEAPGVDKKLGTSGVRMYVATVGDHTLPPTGGMSSSSALTGVFSVGINALFRIGLSLEQLAEVDFGEYLVGKSAGAADKTAQLTAKRGEVVVVGSFPERALGTVRFPKGLTVLMAESPIPRLVTSAGQKWLEKTYPHADDSASILSWARGTLRNFGSGTYVSAVEHLMKGLQDKGRLKEAGVTLKEARAVRRALLKSVKQEIGTQGESQLTDDQIPGEDEWFEYHRNQGLLRELAAGGAIEATLPELAGWENRHKRYDLIYRLLKLIPEKELILPAGDGTMVAYGDKLFPAQADDFEYPRKAALYGIAELERGVAYLEELRSAVAAEERGDLPGRGEHIAKILDLVRWSQDGDRAVLDYRKVESVTPYQPDWHPARFGFTPWASDPRNDVSDATVDRWIADGKELPEVPGGFERSLPEFDEMADAANKEFGGKVAMRVAAAGLGGTMAVHATDNVVPAFKEWIESKGWKVRVVKAGAPTQVITPPKRKIPGELHLQGAEVVVRGEMPVTLLDPLQLPNGSWLVPEGGAIRLSPGVRIGPFVTISAGERTRVILGRNVSVRERTTIEGEVTIGEDSRVWGVIRGHPDAPTTLGPGTQMLHPNAFVDAGVITVPVTDEAGKLHGVKIYDAHIGEEAGKGPVVIWGGTDFRKGVMVRANSVLGPYVHIGPGSEAKATVWMGASANRNDSALAHRAYGGNLIGIPVYLDGTPLESGWHRQLIKRMAALRFGQVISREAEKTTRMGPEVRPRETLVVEWHGKQHTIVVRGLNFGDGSGASNFKSVDGGHKGIGIISAGVAAGVGAKVMTPAFIGPDTLIDNGAQVTGMQAAASSTYVRPIGTTPEKAFRPGAVPGLQGKNKGPESFQLFFAGLRTLQSLARVSLIGFQNSKDPLVRAALKEEIRAFKGHFDEIDAYTAKELDLSADNSAADRLLGEGVERLRSGWAKILQSAKIEKAVSAAGAEQIPLDEAAAKQILVILTARTAEQGVRALSALQGPGGERVKLAVMVRDADQEKEVTRLLDQANLVLATPLLNLAAPSRTLTPSDGVLELEQRAAQLKLAPKVIRGSLDLLDLGRLLVPGEESQLRWNSWVRQQAGLETQM